MNSDLFNPNIVPLLQGIKPYLGSQGQTVTEGILGMVQLLASQHGQEAITTMSKVFSSSGQGDKIVTIDTAQGPITFSLNLVFVLFLILILLVLSGNLLALNSGTVGSDPEVDKNVPGNSSMV